MCGCNASASIVGCHLGRTKTITTTRVEPHSWSQRASYRSCRIWSRPSLISTSQPFLPSAVQRLHVPNFFIEIQNKSYLVYMLQAHWRHCEVIKHGVADLRNHDSTQKLNKPKRPSTEDVTLNLDVNLQNDLDILCCGPRGFPDFHSFIAVCWQLLRCLWPQTSFKCCF